jgi:hypothetical protein
MSVTDGVMLASIVLTAIASNVRVMIGEVIA